MNNEIINIFHSKDQLFTTMIFNRDGASFRVCCLDSYFGTEKEFYFDTLQEAEEFAKEWVL